MKPLRLLALLPGVLAALLIPAAGACAADSHAPRGARADWLPAAEWVMSSWLPYDEARLYALVHTDRDELRGWLDDHRTLGQLAARHGARSQRELAAQLVAPRLHGASARTRRLLTRHALETLTQAHLARHVVFHIFHTPAIPEAAQAVFGMAPQRFRTLRDSGRSPAAIGAVTGRSVARLRAELDRLLVARGQRSVAVGAVSRRQASTRLGEQRADLGAYLIRAYRTPAQQLDFICRIRPGTDA